PFNNAPNPLYDIKTRHKNMMDQVAPKPAWLIIQTGSQFGVPTNAQIRAETYLSIALGSTGIIFYSYDVADANGVHNIKKDGDPAFMKNLITELKSFSPYFLAPTSSKLSYTSNDIDAILKEQDGKLYLIAVNKNASAKSISFTIAGSSNVTARIIGTASAGSTRTGQSINISSTGVLADALQGLEAVVYEIGTTTTTNGDGLTANYFNGINFETPVYSRIDPSINFNWGNGSPNAVVNADRFSVRWSGQIQPQYSETYTFHLNSDNGRRLWINGQLIVDKWIDDWQTEYTGNITLIAGQKYDIKLEHFENNGGAACKMEWSSPSQPKQVVPQIRLSSNPLPSVSISSPSNNTTVNAGNLTIAATATDNGSIAKVEFYNGNTLLGTDTTSPYSYLWNNVPAGTYNLTARATDNQGGIKTSSVVTLVVKSVTVNQSPNVSLTSPATGATYNAPANITISASASDADGSVAKVEFYNGTALLGTMTTGPYSYTWTNAAAGTYSLTAKAYDNSGASTVSATRTVTVEAIVINACSGIGSYTENNGYVTGSVVKHGGKRYECKEWPYSGWCNGAAWAYAPGSGAYWSDAWYDRGSCSARKNAEVSAAVNIEEVDLLPVPNPVVNQLTLLSSQDLTGGRVQLLNAWGAEVLTVDSYAASVDVSALPSGAYLVVWSKGDKRVIKHFVK
ncbi:MAG: type sorting protein, partial [Cytophagaceae bacterium]|nr:type sorting protein [Cytophagaceae bacterium]